MYSCCSFIRLLFAFFHQCRWRRARLQGIDAREGATGKVPSKKPSTKSAAGKEHAEEMETFSFAQRVYHHLSRWLLRTANRLH